MSFDIAIAFDVNTEQLVNARNALQSLGQAASDLNVKQDKANKTSSALVQSTEELTAANTKAAAAANAAAEAITRVGEAAPKASKGAETAEAKLEKLQSQLSFMRDDLDLTSTGFTRSQAGVLAWAKSVGAGIDMLQEYTKVFDDMNKLMGQNPFDQSAKGMAMLNNELRELERSSQLVKDGITLTSQQTKMLTRDLEALKQQNEALGKAASDGASEYERAFIEKAKSVNNLRAVAAEAEREEKERAKQSAAIAKEEERFWADTAREYEQQERRKTEALQREEEKRLAIIENARKSVNDKLMNEWASGVGVKSPELSKMASGYEQEMKAQAAAAKVAADAINYLEQEQRKLAVTTELMARGFTASSASALYKYKEALEATGASAMDVKQKLYLFEQDLINRQDKSPFSQMRKDIKHVQEETNHLARAISVQLGDVAVSLAGGMNPFLVLIQQGDQIRFAVQQAKDAGQDLSEVMQGAFASTFESFKLVYDVVKEFAADGMSTLANSFTAPIEHMFELNRINDLLSSGLIDSARAAELRARANEILSDSMRTLNLVIRGGVLVAIALLAAAYVSLSREQDKVAKMNAQFGASFGATTQEALAMARGLREFGVSTAQAVEAMSGLMKAGKIGKESFQGIAVAASEASKWVGISIEETIKKFNELADDPMKVLSEFTIQTGYLSQAQLQLVRDHLEAGDSAKAQALAIKLLEGGYREMSAQARQDMSDLGVAMNDLKDTTNTLWDSFKNSSSVTTSINTITTAMKALSTVVIFAGLGVKVLATSLAFFNDISIRKDGIDFLLTGGESIKGKAAAFKSSIGDAVKDTRKLMDDLWKDLEAGGSPGGSPGGRAGNSSDASVVKSIEAFTKATEDSTVALAKKLTMGEYVAKRLKEENDKATKGLTESQKEAYLASTEYGKQATDASKKFTKEWEDANKKSSKSVASTYKVARDNELTETKKFYDSQLKGLQDIENKKSQINKSEYESRIISFGKYLAREMRLVEESKKAQTAIINKAEAEYTAAINREKEEHKAAAEAAKAAGGNAKAINEQLAQSIQNIENRTTSYSETVKQQREALERATEAKYAKFYEEIAKQINASKDSLEKFNESVEENARKRSEDLENQRALMGLYGAEAAAYKASTSTMAGYRSEIDRVKKALDKATKSRIDLQKAIAADPNATDAQRKALEEMLKLEEQLREEHNEKLKNAQIDSNQAAMDAIEAYNLEVFKEIRDALSEDIYNALFEGGKSGGDALKSVLNKMFKNYVINVILNPIMGNITGSVMGALGFGGGGGSGGLLGMASNGMSLYNTYQNAPGYINTATSWLGLGGGNAGLGLSAATAGGAMWGGTAAGTGLGLSAGGTGLGMAAPTAGFWAPGATSVGAGAAGSSGTMAGLQTAGIYAAAAVAVAAALGAFRKTKVVDTGIMGTLGVEGGIHDFVQKRKDGSLFSGPKYTLEDHGVSTFDKPMQDAFSAMRTAAIDMGKILGLATDHLKDFTTVITLDSANSSTGTRGLNLKGLSDEEVQAKVQQALEQANNELAQQLIGTWVTPKGNAEAKKLYDEWVGSGIKNRLYSDQSIDNPTAHLSEADRDLLQRAINATGVVFSHSMSGGLIDSILAQKATATRSYYIPSEFAREGETAIETLTRLAQSLSTVNGTLDLLGLELYEGSLAGGDLASKLVDLFGGLEAFTSVTSGYYQNFYSEEERLRKAGETVNEALKSIGVELDVFGGEAAKVQYRELVEKAFAEGNNELAAQLLQMSGAFSEVANAAQAATPELTGYAEALANLEEKAGYLGSTNRFAATEAAGRISGLFSDIGIEKDASMLVDNILGATASDVEDFFSELWPLLESDQAREELIAVSDALLDVAARSKELKLNLATLHERMGDTAAVRDFNLDEVSRELVTFGKSIGREMDIDDVKKQILGANKEAVNAYFNDVWQSLDTAEAQQKFIGITNSILDVVDASEKLAEDFRAQAESLWNDQLDSARKVVEAQIDSHEREAAAIRERITETDRLLNQWKSDRDWFVQKAGRNAGQAGVPSSTTLSLELASTWEEYAANMGYMADLTDGMVSEQQAILDELKKEEARHTESIKNLQGIITESQKQTGQLMSLNEAINLLRTDSETGIQKIVDALSNKAPAVESTKPVDSVITEVTGDPVKDSYNATIKLLKDQRANAVSALAGDETAVTNFYNAMHKAGITMFDDVANHSIQIYDKEIERLQGVVDGMRTIVPTATAPTAATGDTPRVVYEDGWRGNQVDQFAFIEMLSKAANTEWGEAVYGDAIREYGEKFADRITQFLPAYDPALTRAYERITGKSTGTTTGSDTPSGDKTLESVSGLTRAEWEILDSLNMEYLRLTKGEAEVRKAQIAALGKPELQDAQRTVWTQEILNSVEDQMKGLEEAGQLTSIKEGVSELITSITAIGASSVHQLEDSISKVQELGAAQLNKARKELYNQLLPEQEATKLQLEELSTAFEHLGFVMPTTAQGFRAILDSVADGNLRDSLLEIVPAFTSLGYAAETVEDAYARLKQTFVTSEDIAQERISLEERLFDATATTAEKAAAARDVINDYNKSLYDQVLLAERLLAVQNEREGLELKLLELQGNTAEIRRRHIETLYPENRALQLRIWALEDEKKVISDSIDALQKATDARIKELEKTFTATDLALKVLEKAVEQQKKALTEQLDGARKSVETLKKVFETLDNGIKNLRKQVESSNKLQVSEARGLIDTARASGIIPDPDKLSEAVATLTTSVEGGLYATEYDKSRAFLTLANDLESLNAIAEPQLTEAEATVVNLEKQIKQLDELLNDAKTQVENLRKIDASLYGIDESITDVQAAMSQLQTAVKAEEQSRSLIEALNKQLEYYQRQIDAINNVDNSVKSVEEAIKALEVVIAKATTQPPPVTNPPTPGGGGGGSGPTPGGGGGESGYRLKTTSSGATLYFPGGGSHSVQGSDAASILSSTYGLTSGGLNDTLVRTRAEGGYTPSGLTLVGEEGPELVNFKAPSMVYTAAQSANLMRGDNTELVLELQALRSEVSMLRAETRATALNTSKTSRILDDVTQGGNSLKTTNV